MALPVWPASLPQFVLQSGFAEALPKSGMETTMEAGPPKTRRRFTTNWRQFTVSIKCVGTQTDDFETFWISTLASGTLPFTWVSPRTQRPGTFRFHPSSPPGYSQSGEVTLIAFTMEQLA